METQEKSFRDLQQDERLKKLERHLKLIQIKRPTNLQSPSSAHMSFSNISSIHGDNPLSDFSFSTQSVTSSKAGSVILASSNNLRKKLSKNLKIGLKTGPTTSSVFDQSMESKKLDEDRVMMPPPAAITSNEPQPSVDTGQKVQAVKSMTKQSLPQSCLNPTHDIHSLHEAHRLDSNAAVQTDPTKEISNKNDISKHCYARVFKNWIVRLNDHGQLIIRGRLESGEHARSKPVKRRLSATTVLSVLKHKYRLVGDIHDVREELPEYVRGKFYNGFPVDWENVRQIWQGYIASGFSLQFRWPRPMADSDDDLRSDITDLTVAHLKNTSVKPASFVSISHPPQTARQTDRINNKIGNHSQREKMTNDSDISAIYSTVNEDSDARAKTSTVETSCRKITKSLSTPPDKHSANQSQSTSKNSQPNKTESSKYENMVPRWKIDVIIDNLMNKNCSKEYIEKIIRAIDCFNELLTMPLTNNVETTIDEGVSMNYNSNGQTDTTSNKIYDIEKTEMLKNVDSSKLRHSKQAAVALSSSYSAESFEESQEEPQSKHETFLCEQSLTSIKNNSTGRISTKLEQSRHSAFEPKNFPNHSDIVNREQNISTPPRLTSPKYDLRHIENKRSQDTATLPREEIVGKSTKSERYKRKNIFDSADSDTEGPVLNKPRTSGTNNSSIVNTSLQRTPRSKHQSVPTEKIKNGFLGGASDAYCDSDISIVDASIGPGVKPRIISIQKMTDDLIKRNHQREILSPDFSFANNEKFDHSKANPPVPKSSGNLGNQKTSNSSSVKLADQCTVRLNKITTDQNNRSTRNCTPTRIEKKATGHQKSRIDTRRRITEQPETDAENVSMRMSSRGRRILPPLDYWNGERVSLKGRELVYSPGATSTAFSTANYSTVKHVLSPNTTSISEPMPVSGSARNLNKTPTAVESMNKNTRRIGGILSEISANHDENGDHETISDRRVTRSVNNTQRDAEKSRKSRRQNQRANTSSDEETIPLVRNRKKRRIY